MTRLTLIIFSIISVLNGQTNLAFDLSSLFGNLPMDLTVKKIIEVAEKDKNFKGTTHYNLDLSYTGEIKSSNFFQLNPDTRFIEIVANASELFPDSSLTDVTYFSFDAGYKSSDSSSINKEFKRICTLFSKHFSPGNIIYSDNKTYFYKSTDDKRPSLTVYMPRDIECYDGARCIKFAYFR